MEADESLIMADLAIFEFYLHRSVLMKLQNFDSVSNEEMASLEQATQLSRVTGGASILHQ